MTKAGFDLSDRGVDRPRRARRARRLRLDRARHLPRRRDRACRGACPRRRGQGGREPAAHLHLHAPRRRRGPPHRLATARRPAAMPSISRLSPTPCAAPGRCAIHTDPKEPAVASQTFLVEDFVPDRIEFDLTSDKHGDRRRRDRPTSPSTAASSMARRPPASRSKARSTLDHHARMGRASRATSSASPTSRTARRPAFRSTDLPLVGDDGKATFPVAVDAAAVDHAAAQRRRDACACARPAAAPSSARSTSPSRPTADMIGIRPDFAGDEVPQGGTAEVHASSPSMPTASRKAHPRRAAGRWSRSSATTSGIAPATPGTTSR